MTEAKAPDYVALIGEELHALEGKLERAESEAERAGAEVAAAERRGRVIGRSSRRRDFPGPVLPRRAGGDRIGGAMRKGHGMDREETRQPGGRR